MGDEHLESPARQQVILDALTNCEFSHQLQHHQASLIEPQLLSLSHDQAYIDYVYANAPSQGQFILDADTQMNPASLNATLRAAGAAKDAVDLVMTNKAKQVFCATRPPGHHAERDKALGFCIFNGIATAALYAQKHYHLKKIAILDFDVHHGNGTQEILLDKTGFLFCSTFQHPLYPDSGTEQTPSHIINSPLTIGTTGTQYREIIKRDWLLAIAQYQPDLILVSAGFDAHTADDISEINLDETDYQWLGQQLKQLADTYCEGKMVSVLEGGYSLEHLGSSVVAYLQGIIE
jgi:acetoin utilization deacetylase AcuC-like enzyme